MRVALCLTIIILLALPSAAFAVNGAAITTVYVTDAPDLSVRLVQSDGKLLCSWNITDSDGDDSFSASVTWLRDGKSVSVQPVDCGAERYCSLQGPAPNSGEYWKCLVAVKDSYENAGSGSAEFQLTPLSFLGGLLQGLLALFGLK